VTYDNRPHILIVDDDEGICKTFSVILQSEGYQTTTANTGKEALEKAKTRFFNLALVDIKLPDINGIQLLAKLQEICPETIKIMVTGYPSLKNAVDALNLGADSYIMKPVDPSELLKTIKARFETQKQTEEITRDKLAKWIQSQARKTQSSNFQEFLEKTAKELARFGLTKNQARIYTTLIASGVASTSEIASLSKVRREEVYRIIPELEKRGIIIRKLEKPRKFVAVQPETSIKILAQSKLKNMKEEIDELQQEQAKLITELKTIVLSTKQEDCAIEAISQQDIVLEKLLGMTRKAKRKIDIITTTTNLRFVYMNYPREVLKRILKTARMRVITEKCELDTFSREILQPSKTTDNSVELRCLKKLPFSLFIVDDKEALWGTQPTQITDEKLQVYWANDSTQLSILQASFERLWQESSLVET